MARLLQNRATLLRCRDLLRLGKNSINQLPRLPTGIPGLDTILGGGLVEGASYIVQGHPGAGKTIFANQVAFSNLSHGGKALYVTLLADTHDRLFQSLGTLQFFDASQLGRSITYVSVFQTLRDEGLSAVVSVIRQEIARQGATLLVFDGLLGARDRADTQLDVKTFVAEDSPEHTMVDGVIELHNELAGVRAVRRLQVKKSRGSAGLGGYHQFEITATGMATFPRMEAMFAPAVADDDHVNPLSFIAATPLFRSLGCCHQSHRR
jgi:circadian clock protein KaiC